MSLRLQSIYHLEVQKVNFEKYVVFNDNVFDFKDRTTILAASCLSRQGASKNI